MLFKLFGELLLNTVKRTTIEKYIEKYITSILIKKKEFVFVSIIHIVWRQKDLKL